MVALIRIIDSDERSLDDRVRRAIAGLQEGCTVDRFTHWYTTRPPVHEAVILAPR